MVWQGMRLVLNIDIRLGAAWWKCGQAASAAILGHTHLSVRFHTHLLQELSGSVAHAAPWRNSRLRPRRGVLMACNPTLYTPKTAEHATSAWGNEPRQHWGQAVLPQYSCFLQKLREGRGVPPLQTASGVCLYFLRYISFNLAAVYSHTRWLQQHRQCPAHSPALGWAASGLALR